MQHSSSIPALLLRLAGVKCRRHPWLAAGACTTILAAFAFTAGDSVPTPVPVQAAVLKDGFAVMDGGPGQRRVTEVDRAGKQQRAVNLELTADARLVGTRGGTSVAWHEGAKLRLGRLAANGELVESSTWGQSVQRLCEGVASNDAMFAVSWLEANGKIWLLHGPVAANTMAVEAGPTHQALASSKWCGIASAEHKVALMWTERDRLILNFCDKRQCSGFRAPVLIDADDTLLGFGCLRDSCLIAARDPKGATRVHLVNQLGKVQWSRPLTTARDAPVTIVGAGDRSFAVATRGDADATVHRFTRDGASTLLWDRRGAEAPSLAWSAGKLMVGYRHDRNVVTEVLAVPR